MTGGNNMTQTGQIVESLGGRKILGRNIRSLEQLREQVRKGLPYGSVEALAQKLRLQKSEAAALMHLPERTLARRKKQNKLRADESDRLFRIARIQALAAEVLGSEDKAADWLRRPNRALNGQSPLERLDTDLGTKQVEDILGRIQHGIIG